MILQSFRFRPCIVFLARISWQFESTKYYSMKKSLIYFLLILFIFPFCTGKRPNIITYDLRRSDYLETINATGTIQAVNSTTILAPVLSATNLIKITHLAEDGSYVQKGDTICIFEAPAGLLTYIETFSVDLQNMEADLKKLEADIAMRQSQLNAQVETNKAQIAITMLDSIQMKFAPPVKKQLLELEMQKATIEKNKLQKKVAAQKRIDNSELVKLRSRIAMQKSRVDIFKTEVNSLNLVSPVNGMIMHIENYRIDGNYITIGPIEEGSSTLSKMAVLQIPDFNAVQILLEVQEADYKRIQNGKKVQIRVESVAGLNTTGKIQRKTLQRKANQPSSALKTYEIIVSVDSCHLKMKPGLSATCRIIVDEVKDTIVVPTMGIFLTDSSKTVYVAEEDKFRAVSVETGLSNSSGSIVTHGLTGSEVIALSEPPHNLIIRSTVKPVIINPDINDSLFKKSITNSKQQVVVK